MPERSRVRRQAHRGSSDGELIRSILDEGLVAHVAIQVDGQPFVLPMAYVRRGDALLLHGSTASRLTRFLAAGEPACVAVTLVDGMVLARSLFHHSMNYRSVVVFGTARSLEGDEKRQALVDFVERLLPGRASEAREVESQEAHGTTVLELRIEEASAKVRSGPPTDRADDQELDVWAGVIPLLTRAGVAMPAPDVTADRSVPESAERFRARFDGDLERDA